MKADASKHEMLIRMRTDSSGVCTMRFTYSSGQRPLDGYTLKRGIGRGGFGEVYFAISDGGKEVALKLVRGDRDIEMRGVSPVPEPEASQSGQSVRSQGGSITATNGS